MTLRHIVRTLALAAALLSTHAAHAQLFRAYLAIDGNDANPCTLPQPCRLLPAALNAVADGGEIWMLDSANYNTATVNIAKSVKILAVPGVVGSVVATGGPAISIATAGVNVALRNLVIVPLPGGGGTSGVVVTAGQSLTIEDSLITGTMTGSGISVFGSAIAKVVGTTIRVSGAGANGISMGSGTRVTVTRAVISASGSNAIGVQSGTAGTTTTLSVSGSTLEGSLRGLWVQSTHATAAVRVSVSDSQVDRNEYGLHIDTGAGAAVTLAASGNVVTNSTSYGIAAQGTGARVWATANTVTDNGYGLVAITAGVFESAGNNAVRNNGLDEFGTVTVVPMK